MVTIKRMEELGARKRKQQGGLFDKIQKETGPEKWWSGHCAQSLCKLLGPCSCQHSVWGAPTKEVPLFIYTREPHGVEVFGLGLGAGAWPLS